jgi:hypothetical protein
MSACGGILCRTGRVVEADIGPVVDRTGSVVREGMVDSDPEAISVYVRSKGAGYGTHRPRDRTVVHVAMDRA